MAGVTQVEQQLGVQITVRQNQNSNGNSSKREIRERFQSLFVVPTLSGGSSSVPHACVRTDRVLSLPRSACSDDLTAAHSSWNTPTNCCEGGAHEQQTSVIGISELGREVARPLLARTGKLSDASRFCADHVAANNCKLRLGAASRLRLEIRQLCAAHATQVDAMKRLSRRQQ